MQKNVSEDSEGSDPQNLPNCPFNYVEISELNPEYRSNPIEKLRHLQNECPISRDSFMGRILLVGYDSVSELLRNNQLSKNFLETVREDSPLRNVMLRQDDELTQIVKDRWPDYLGPRSTSMLYLDGDNHRRVRSVFQDCIKKRLDKIDEITKAIVADVIAGLGTGGFDIVAEFSMKIPVRVIGSFLGAPRQELDKLQKWADSALVLFSPLSPPDEMHRGREAIAALLMWSKDMLEQRMESPSDDFISDIAIAKKAGYDISEEEIVENIVLLFSAGYITTTDLISSVFLMLLENPATISAVRSDPALARNVVEEALRLNPPIMSTARTSAEHVICKDVEMPAQEYIVASIAAANRDASVFDKPDEFDMWRKETRHVSFSGGSHFCLGASIARLEAGEAVRALIEAFPKLRFRDAAHFPEWRSTPIFRGLQHLHVLVA
jgi:cytochrome P450